MEKHYAIAIDGPSASGKSTAAKGVAKRLNFLYIDTGAMYRAFTLLMLEKKLDPKSPEDAKSLLNDVSLKEDREGHIYLNGKDVSTEIRSIEVTNNVSYACAHKEVREKLVELQQKMASDENVVMDGRDIGTVVLKNADLKIYQVASVEARAKRRYEEFLAHGVKVTYEEIKEDLNRRDYIDSHRENSPLTKADDAILLDTSDMTIEEEIQAIIDLFYQKVGGKWNSTEK